MRACVCWRLGLGSGMMKGGERSERVGGPSPKLCPLQGPSCTPPCCCVVCQLVTVLLCGGRACVLLLCGCAVVAVITQQSPPPPIPRLPTCSVLTALTSPFLPCQPPFCSTNSLLCPSPGRAAKRRCPPPSRPLYRSRQHPSRQSGC